MNTKQQCDEFSAGFILYRKTQPNRIEYLILQSSKKPQNWTPPKVCSDWHVLDHTLKLLNNSSF